MMKTIKRLLLLLVFVLIIVFVLQNGSELTKPVVFRFNLYIQELALGPSPLYSILLISFFSGLLIAGVLGWIHRLRLNAQYKRLHRLFIEKDRELNSLRNLPVLGSESQGEGESTSSQPS